MLFCLSVLTVYAICLHEAQKCLDQKFMILVLGFLPRPLSSLLLGTASLLCVYINDALKLPMLSSTVTLLDKQDLSSSSSIAFGCLLPCPFLLPSNQHSSLHSSETPRESYSVQLEEILFTQPYECTSNSVSGVLGM